MADWDNAPTILIFGDSEEGLAVASEAAIANGARIVAALSIAQAADRLDSQIAVDLVVVDVGDDVGTLVDPLFGRIAQGANDRRFAGIVTVAPGLEKMASAKLGGEKVHLLVGRDRSALTRTIASELIRPPLQLAENDEADDIARRPMSGPEGEPLHDAFMGDSEDGVYGALPERVAALVAENLEAPSPEVVNGIIRARRLRSQFFGNDLFADPAWDILLDLMAARIERRSVAVSSLCIAAAVPATTALRWIRQLTDAGLLQRVADPLDGRRVFIELTDNAVATLTAYFKALMRANRLG